MTLLDEYQQAHPGSGFPDSWRKFTRLLDEDTYFFAPKSYGARARRSLQLLPESERLEKARQQVRAYQRYSPLKRFAYWLFDISDISAKRVWIAYSDLRKVAETGAFTGRFEPTLDQFKTFQQGFNALTPLMPWSWGKVMKSIHHFFSFLLQSESKRKTQRSPESRMKLGIELVELRPLPIQSKAVVLRTAGENARVMASDGSVLPWVSSLSFLTLGSGLSSSEIDKIAKWVSPSEDSAQTGSGQLTFSSSLTITAPPGFNFSKDDNLRWSYVFICSYFDIDWTNPDKKVVQQEAERSFRKNFALQVHPDKKPEFFKQEWCNRAYWEKKVAEMRSGEFDLAVEMREALFVILKDNEVIDLKWKGGCDQALIHAVKQGSDLRKCSLGIVTDIQEAAKSNLQREEYKREGAEYRRHREEYKRQGEEYRRQREEHERHTEEVNRQADEIQKQLDELAKQKKERAKKRLVKERLRKQFTDILIKRGYDVDSEIMKEISADPENFKEIFDRHIGLLSQAIDEQTKLQTSAHSAASKQAPMLPDAVSAKAFVHRINTSGFLDKLASDLAHSEKEDVSLDSVSQDEQQSLFQAGLTSA